MLVVGLTGGIGCGKSLVSDLFHDLFNIPVIDADVISRELTQTKSVIDLISQQLGPKYIDKNNNLLRKKLREAVFSDSRIRVTLEKILHPLVYNEIKESINKLNAKYCLVVIPLLFEKNQTEFLDRILVVDCTIEEQITRVTLRDKSDENHVKSIIETQIDRTSRLSLADDIINNSGDTQSLRNKITLLDKKYTELSEHVN